jgi:glucose-6-phosphate 1-epimerase
MTLQPPLVEGHGGLPKIAVAAADGARFEAYTHGAQVTSWCPAGDGDERLFVSEAAHFAAGEPIRGGVPVCFPQFADQGPLPMHGFARVMAWSVVSAGQRADGAAHALFRLADDASTHALWPHAFACEVEVTALGGSLTIELRVTNAGPGAFDFTTALHTYLRVHNVQDVRIAGFCGAHYRDKVLRQNDVIERAPGLVIDRPIDRVYRVVPQVVELREGGATLQVRARGTTDTVVWNPGPPTAATPADLAPDSYPSFVCIEAAVASAPITLAAGQTFRAAQILTLI